MEYAEIGPRLIDSCYNRGLITLENEEGSSYPVSAGIVGQTYTSGIDIIDCYNAGDVILRTSDDATGIRWGSLVGLIIGKHLLKNNFCYINDELKSVGVMLDGSKVTTEEIVEYKNKEDIKSIADKLGNNFKADTKEINEGYPILTWQE